MVAQEILEAAQSHDLETSRLLEVFTDSRRTPQAALIVLPRISYMTNKSLKLTL
jgi:hypothetical protein